ncbi:hypothetical protein ABID22_000156 [Pontibacter aydingkolensis]
MNKADTLNNSRFYVGVEFSSIYYRMVKDERTVSGEIIPVAHFNLGYRLSKRVQLELGVTYGRNKDNVLRGTYYGYNDTIIHHYEGWKHSGIAVPLTVKYTPFNLSRRLNLHATASLIPVLGEVNQQLSEVYKGETKITYDAHDSGLYLHATAGLLLNYKLSKKLEAYTKANLFIEDLRIKNYYRPKSLSLGLNYNL